jgi:MFS family permease
MSLDLPTSSTNVFRHRSYSLFWASRCLMNVGVQIESVAIGWQVYAVARLTSSVEQSAFLVGMVGLAQFVPMFLLTLVAGAMADRLDRRKMLVICIAVETVCVIVLAVLALHPQPSFVPIFVIAVIFGAARAFLTPASGAMGPMLVPKEELPRAIAWNSMAWQSASIAGPFLGGILVAFSATVAYGATAVIYALSAVTLVLIRHDTKPVSAPQSRWAAVKEGLVYVWRTKEVLGAISLDLFAVLLGGATALLPVFAKDVLHVGASGFGLLRAGPAIGAVILGFWISRWPLQRRAGMWMFSGVAAFGLGTLIFALSRNVWLSVAALMLLGAGDMLSVNVRQTLVQIVTPDHMRGRVSAVAGLFIGASNELGEFESGVAARLLGPVGAAVFGGIGALVVTALWAWMFPTLRKADKLLEM